MLTWLLLSVALAGDVWEAPEPPPEEPPPAPSAYKPAHPAGQVWIQGGLAPSWLSSVDPGVGLLGSLVVGYRAKAPIGVHIALSPLAMTFTDWQGAQGMAKLRLMGGLDGRYLGLQGGVALYWADELDPAVVLQGRFGAIDGGYASVTIEAVLRGDTGPGFGSVDVRGQLPFELSRRQVWIVGHAMLSTWQLLEPLVALAEVGPRVRLLGDGGSRTVEVSASLGVSTINTHFGPQLGLAAEVRL